MCLNHVAVFSCFGCNGFSDVVVVRGLCSFRRVSNG